MKQALVLAGKTHHEILFTEPRDSRTRVIAALRKNRSEASVFEEVCAAGISFSEMLILVSKDQVTVRLLDLPTTDTQEINDIVSIQAGKQTPFSKSEIVWDYRITESPRHGYAKVFLGVVQKEKVDLLCRDLGKAAQVEAAVGLDCEYMTGWDYFRAHKSAEEVYAVLDWTSDGVDFTVIEFGQVVFTKMLQIDTRAENDSDWEEQFARETRFAMGGYQTDQAGPPIEKIVVHASPEMFERIRSVLAKKLSVEVFPAAAHPPDLEISKEAAASLKEFADSGITFAKLLGAAGRKPALKKLDFTPPLIKKRHEDKKQSRRLILTGALTGLLVLSLLSVYLEKRFSSLFRLNALTRMERELAKNTGPLAEVDRRIQFIKTWLGESSSTVAILGEIGSATPAGVYLTELVYDEKETALRGTAAVQAGVYQYTKNLEDLRRFDSMKIRYANKRQAGSQEVIDFEIVCSAKELPGALSRS